MKPLIQTVHAVSELATGLSPDAVPTADSLVQLSTPDFDFLVSVGDDETAQRIIFARTQNLKDPYVPDSAIDSRREILSRVASFAERTRKPGSISLPRQW